jgi:hypothetical protein
MKIFTRAKFEAAGVLEKTEAPDGVNLVEGASVMRMQMSSLDAAVSEEPAAEEVTEESTDPVIPDQPPPAAPTTITVTSYDDLATQLYARIRSQDDQGYDQRQLFRDLTAEGYEIADIQLGLAIIQRQKKIIYLGGV